MSRNHLIRIASLLGLLLSLLPVVPVAATAPIIEWTRQFEVPNYAWPNNIVADSTGNVYVAGTSFVRQYHPDGSEGWTHQLGPEVSQNKVAIAVDYKGNVYVAWTTYPALPGQSGYAEADVFVRQYRTDGTEGWTRQFGTDRDDVAYGIVADATGNVYVTGDIYFWGQPTASNVSTSVFVRQFRADGTEGWSQQFGTDTEVHARSIAVDAAGEVYVSGFT